MTKTNLFRWELIGGVMIAVVGSLFHFCYEWTNGWGVAGFFCAVNESVWEHMKIGFWPALFFGVVMWFNLKNPPQNFWFAEMTGLYTLVLTIPILFYSYTAVLGSHILVIDILIFVIAVGLGRLVSYWILTHQVQEPWKGMTRILLLVILFAFSMFTYYPPHILIFQDPQSGGYGIN